MHAPPRRLGPRGRAAFDLAVVVLLLLPATAQLSAPEPLRGWISIAQILPLLARRRWPAATFGAIGGLHVLQVVLLDQPVWGQVAFLVGLYSVARYASARAAWVALAVGGLAAPVAAYDWVVVPVPPGGSVDLPVALVTAGVCAALSVAAWSVGTTGRVQEAYVATLVTSNAQVLREAEQRAALAAADERARIAREMHDVVAHGLSVMVVQADGARYAAASGAAPDVAEQALSTIAATGRESLADMRRLLGLLREDDTGTAPQPGLADLPGLIESARAGGTPVAVAAPDPLPDLRAAVGLTGYRVVQEALTNVRKHAGNGARVEVEVEVTAGRLSVSVRDDGVGAPDGAGHAVLEGGPDAGLDGGTGTGTGIGPGHGLRGMRERVEALGGTLQTGRREDGRRGFEVRASLPRDRTLTEEEPR